MSRHTVRHARPSPPLRGRSPCPWSGWAWLLLTGWLATAVGGSPGPGPRALRYREVYVPHDALGAVLEQATGRVLLPRSELEELVRTSSQGPSPETPKMPAAIVSAVYDVHMEGDVARIRGLIGVRIAGEELCAVPLPLERVGLLKVELDGGAAALARADDSDAGDVLLLVRGEGEHTLTLEGLSCVLGDHTRRVLSLAVPLPPGSRLRLHAPGRVTLKQGAAVIESEYDSEAGVTRLDLLPPREEVRLELTPVGGVPDEHQLVSARTVVETTVGEDGERVRAGIEFQVLCGSVTQFRAALPPGYEVSDVSAPGLSRWQVEPGGEEQTVRVRLGSGAGGQVRVTVTAFRNVRLPVSWSFPMIRPLDVVHNATWGTLHLCTGVRAESVDTQGVITLDSSAAGPRHPGGGPAPAETESVEARPVLRFFAPGSSWRAGVSLLPPDRALSAQVNERLAVRGSGLEVRTDIVVAARQGRFFEITCVAPSGWDVVSVTGAKSDVLQHELEPGDGGTRLCRLLLGEALMPGSDRVICLRLSRVPPEWYSAWTTRRVPLPCVRVAEAGQQRGLLLVDADDGLAVRPERLSHVSPVNGKQRPKGRAGSTEPVLALRYERVPFAVGLGVTRRVPRVTADTYSFLRVQPDGVAMRCEMVFEIRQAATRRLCFSLPVGPAISVSVAGMRGVSVEECSSSETEEGRLWVLRLAEPTTGRARVGIAFRVPLSDSQTRFDPPVPRAEEVAYQSGRIAVEGDPRLDVAVADHPRAIDIGEFADVVNDLGPHVLGAYGYVGRPPPLRLHLRRPQAAARPAVVTHKARLVSLLSSTGRTVSAATYRLRSQPLFLGFRLPAGSVLWSASVDGVPVRPQQDDGLVLLDLPGGDELTRDVEVVYETPTARLGFVSSLPLAGPDLVVHGRTSAADAAIPVVDLEWRVYPPAGYSVVSAGGSTVTGDVPHVPTALGMLVNALGLVVGEERGETQRKAESAMRFVVIASLLVAALYHLGRRAKPSWIAGLLLVALLVIMAGMMLPALNQAREKARRINCSGNLKQIGLALRMYSGDNEGAFPPDYTYLADGDYLSSIKMYSCPSCYEMITDVLQSDYRYVGGGRSEQGKDDSRTVIAYCDNHVKLVSVLFADGHVQGVAVDSIEEAAGRHGWILPVVAKRRRSPSADPLEGVRGLTIGVRGLGTALVFRSLGTDPLLQLRMADTGRAAAASLALGLSALVAGLFALRDAWGPRYRYVAGLMAAAVLLPAVLCRPELGVVLRGLFHAAAVLAVVTTAGMAVRRRRMAAAPGGCGRACGWWFGAGLTAVGFVSGDLRADDNAARRQLSLPCLEHRVSGCRCSVVGHPENREPGTEDQRALVPRSIGPAAGRGRARGGIGEDVIVVPYDLETGTEAADGRVLFSLRELERLRSAARACETAEPRPPADVAASGAHFEAELTEEGMLTMKGGAVFEVFAARPVLYPMRLGGVSVAGATVEGKGVALGALSSSPEAGRRRPVQAGGLRALRGGDVLMAQTCGLWLRGKGAHRLDLLLQAAVQRRQGWSSVEVQLPAFPAAEVALRVPMPGTEVRLLNGPIDRRTLVTEQAGEIVRTALSPDGRLTLQWRPQLQQAGPADPTLTVQSKVRLVIREDGLAMAWTARLKFRSGRRTGFTLLLPGDCVAEGVSGSNVRRWEVRRSSEGQLLEVELLRSVSESETLTVRLRRPEPVVGGANLFRAPTVAVEGAARHAGRLVILRSEGLRVRAIREEGLSRVDCADREDAEGAEPNAEGLPERRLFRTYDFPSVPFVLDLETCPTGTRVAARTETILRVTRDRRSVEARVLLNVRGRPLHQVTLVLPEGLAVDRLAAPSPHESSEVRAGGERRLVVRFGVGQLGAVALTLSGRLGVPGPASEAPLPRFAVLEAEDHSGELVIQASPALSLTVVDLGGLDPIHLRPTYGWLRPDQRPLARQALRSTSSEYGGRVRWQTRAPVAQCYTVTNVRITDRAIEETILLDFTVRESGLKEVSFLLPRRFATAPVEVPLLQEKVVEVLPDTDRVRVRLVLQDEVSGGLRILLTDDRALSADEHGAPVPDVETGETMRRYVAVESAGRDEVVIVKTVGLRPLTRLQQEWQRVAGLLSSGTTQAFLAAGAGRKAALVFRTRTRAAVETAGARVGLSQTVLVLDANGAYRAEQTYHIDNRTEQYLEIDLPEGALLWDVRVAGRHVEPLSSADPRRRVLRIPLVRTAPGDLDYSVALSYGGRRPRLCGPRRTELPLIRAANINVESGQVELRLPRTHRWGGFGGGVSHVLDPARFDAVVLAYKNGLAERLFGTLRAGSKFSKARARSNLKEMKRSLDSSRKAAAEGQGGDRALAAELERSKALLAQTTRELAEARERQATAERRPNGLRLREHVASQQTVLVHDVARAPGPNWTDSGGHSDVAMGPAAGAMRKHPAPAVRVPETNAAPLERSQEGEPDRDAPEGRSRPAGTGAVGVPLPPFDPARWGRYRFTTPRGEVTVHARAIPYSVITAGKRIGWALLFVLLLAVVGAIARSGGVSRELARPLSTWLLVLSAACVVLGVVPLLAAVGVVAGIFLRVAFPRTTTA